MTDDIVTRLREQCCCTEDIWCSDACIAADDIECLRKQIRQLEAERDQWQRQAMSHG